MKTKLILTLIALCLLASSCKKENSRICELYSLDVGYAIGKIQSNISTPFTVTHYYDYSVDGIEYTGEEKAYGIGQDYESMIGLQFIVIYALSDKTNSDLNTDYLIESEQDFIDFNTEFSSGPPSPDYPNNCD